MTINRLNQGTTNQVLVKAISGQTTNLLELQDSSGNVVSSIGPTGALGGTVGNSGLVHISTTSFTSVASHSVNDVFSSTYKNYKIIGNVKGTGAFLTFRLRVSGSDNSSANYNYGVFDQRFESVTTITGTHSGTSQTSWANFGTVDTNNSPFEAIIFSPFETEYTAYSNTDIQSPGGANGYQRTSRGNTTVNTSYTGFTLASSSMTGTVSVYGFKV